MQDDERPEIRLWGLGQLIEHTLAVRIRPGRKILLKINNKIKRRKKCARLLQVLSLQKKKCIGQK